MSQKIPIYIPTFINSATYTPARVVPRIYFYNGNVDCETWYIADSNNAANAQTSFPYFDHYNVVTGSFPTAESNSLLFNNEAPAYGGLPTGSLYSEYWQKYITFLYDPKTRLLNCSAIIPLADYFKMELNDIVNFRGNYYHLRAINDYSLKTGECSLQLLGPIIADTFDSATANTPTTTTTTTSTTTTTTTTSTTTTTTTTTVGTSQLGWSFTETGGANGTMDIYVNGSVVESRSITSTGTWTGLHVGDEIYFEINVTGCSGLNDYANAYSTGIIIDAACDTGVTFLSSTTYTVQPGDIGNTLTLGMFASCDSGCL